MIEDTPLGTAFVLLGVVVLGIVLIYRSRRTLRTRPLPAKIGLLLTALCGTLLVLELYFAFFYVASDAGSYTLSNQKWIRKYWHPINEFGYRDRDYSRDDFRGKKIVYVVGDSFVAGTGIEKVEDRFPDVAQERLGSDYVVVNIAVTGWSTNEEYDAIVDFSRHFGISPDVVVLSYYINDIRGSAEEKGYVPRIRGVPPALMFLARHSNFLDFAFWRLYRLSRMFDVFWVYIEDVYGNDAIWQAHTRKLDEISEFARSNGARLVVLAFPSLVKIDFSKPFTSRVCDHFRRNGVQCLDLASDLESWKVKDLIVSSADPHPSVELHRHVGLVLTDTLMESTGGADLSAPDPPGGER